jgi:predicted RecB family nuclease
VQVTGGMLRLSATDIANHLACRHLTWLDRCAAEGKIPAPAWRDPGLELLRERGFRHERAFVEHLEAAGVRVVQVPADPGPAVERTLAAMKSGAGAIVQAPLGSGRWAGRADILLRVETESDLGGWSYEAADTKLAQETRAGTLLQLCLYTELLGQLQGRLPALMHVVPPRPGFPRESFRFEDYGAYYRLARQRLETAVDAAPAEDAYPSPVEHCDICRWWKECDARRHADDHLSLVAGIRPLHVVELQRQGIDTLRQYAAEKAPVREKPLRGGEEAFRRAHGQAVIQHRGREQGKMLHEPLPLEEGRGLSILPEPDPGDIYFDIEADPFAGEEGLEYLLGYAAADELPGLMHYTPLWALDRAEEKRALQAFMDAVTEKWEQRPGMHVYHFSPYEPGAVKRMVGRHGTREEELDRFLRSGRFVDLFAATRQGLRVGVESYSLKALEACFGFRRQVELRDAGAALRRVARALELAPGAAAAEITAAERAAVETYNRDDCLSTAALHAWLEKQRREVEKTGQKVPRPLENPADASDAVEEMSAKVKAVFDSLTAGLPEDRAAWGAADRARWLLAHLLEYFRREDKCAWWEYFRVQGLEGEELLEERKAIAGLSFVGPAGGSAKNPVHRYAFPPQEAALRPGDELVEIGGGPIGKVGGIDLARCTLDVRRNGGGAGAHPRAVMVNERVRPHPLDAGLLAFAQAAARGGVDGAGPFRAARDLLLQYPPRLRAPRAAPFRAPSAAPLRAAGEDAVDAAIRLARDLDNGMLPIQGPPGSGKTYTGARMILALLRDGKRVGVTAVSHKVIGHLLANVAAAAENEGAPIRAVHKVATLDAVPPRGIVQVTDNAQARSCIRGGTVVGGTCWFWAREDNAEAVDYLFIDEAGQMSLAYALSAGRSARNLVLLGDPQQLEQPQRGVHPEGAETAALVHALRGRRTLPNDAGLFLEETRRLHPEICAFTSEVFYEGRLRSRAGLERQAIGATTLFAGSGLYYVPVVHEGCQSSSGEEVEAVAKIVEDLLSPGATWTDAEGRAHPLKEEHILVVAPYNAQVAALGARLPGVQAGTVDRFQGQEAPVVIYSMTSSSAADAPHGMGFLYDPHRLNVATSRARCACIIVATRRLLEPECGTPEQMLWANSLCRYREMAKERAV